MLSPVSCLQTTTHAVLHSVAMRFAQLAFTETLCSYQHPTGLRARHIVVRGIPPRVPQRQAYLRWRLAARLLELFVFELLGLRGAFLMTSS